MTLEELEQERRRERDEDISKVMSLVPGRRFVWRQLLEAGVFAETFSPGQPDVSAYRQGRRAQGLDLLADVMRVSPKEYELMVIERQRAASEFAGAVALRSAGEADSTG